MGANNISGKYSFLNSGASESAATPPQADKADQNPEYTGQFLASQLHKTISKIDFIKPPTKRARVILWMLIAAIHNRTITRFDAEYIGEHCLNTSISVITSIDRIIVNRRETKRPTRFAKPTDCKEYWLEGMAINKAALLILKLLDEDSQERFQSLIGNE